MRKSFESGFSLLELIVVLAGLGILSSLTIPNYIRLLDFNNIDEVKSLLNTAAADCLQKSRLNDPDTKELINDGIISDKRLGSLGYKIDVENGADQCSYFQLQPTDAEDNIRYPIGFSVLDGKLLKFAEPTSSDQGSISSCENWAGIKCEQDESLKKLIDYKKEISAAKVTCEEDYKGWVESGTSPFKFYRWNTSAEASCPSRPPQDGSESYKNSTCTPNGCNREVFGLDGEFVGYTKEDYDRALEAKYGKLCTEWVAQKESEGYTNDPIDTPLTKEPECGSQEFWFFEGELIDGKSALEIVKCRATHEEWRTKGINQRYAPIGGPGECGNEIFVCNYSLVSDRVFYDTKDCGLPPKICGCYYADEEPYCKTHETSSYMVERCGVRPDIDDDPKKTTEGKCGQVGKGRPSTKFGSWNITTRCNEWSRCMNYYTDDLGCHR